MSHDTICIPLSENECRKSDIRARITELELTLEKDDYKIVKAMECFLAGTECEYKLEELHKERQAMRDEINQLEKELVELEDD